MFINFHSGVPTERIESFPTDDESVANLASIKPVFIPEVRNTGGLIIVDEAGDFISQAVQAQLVTEKDQLMKLLLSCFENLIK